MSNKYTEREVLTKNEELSGRPVVLNRRQATTAEEIVSGLVGLTYRSLNSDIDSVYDLIGRFSNDQALVCTEILDKVSELYDLSTSLRKPDETFDEDRMSAVRASASRALFSSGTSRELAILDLRRNIEAALRVGSSEKSPQHARERSTELLMVTR